MKRLIPYIVIVILALYIAASLGSNQARVRREMEEEAAKSKLDSAARKGEFRFNHPQIMVIYRNAWLHGYDRGVDAIRARVPNDIQAEFKSDSTHFATTFLN